MSRVICCREMLDPERPAHQRERALAIQCCEHAQALYEADALTRARIETRNARLSLALVLATSLAIWVVVIVLVDRLAGVLGWW